MSQEDEMKEPELDNRECEQIELLHQSFDGN